MSRKDIKRADLSRLIALAYQAADPSVGWHPFLFALGDELSAGTPALLSHDMRGGAGGIAVNVRADPEATRLYNEFWYQHDPWATAPGAAALSRPGHVIVDTMLLPAAVVARTAYHQEFALRFGLSRILSLVLAHDVNRVQFLTVTRAITAPPFGEAEAQVGEALIPHLQGAIRLASLVASAQVRAESAAGSLDALTFGVLLVDTEGRIHHANTAARAMLARADGLVSDHDGLRGATADATRALRGLCAGCATRTPQGGSRAGGAVLLPRPSGLPDLHVLVLPNRIPVHLDALFELGRALVFVHDPADQPPSAPDLLRAYFGLTNAEAEVAAHVATGRSVEEVAAALGYTKETLRWYVKQLLNRTGSRSRSELMRQLSSPLLRVRTSSERP